MCWFSLAMSPFAPGGWFESIEFRLPDGRKQKAETKLHLRNRLETGQIEQGGVVVYDPYDPSRAVALNSFQSPLEVSDDGNWRFSAAESRERSSPDTETVFVSKSGDSYHRGACRFVSKQSKAVPLRYAQRHYDPCEVCDPPTLD